MGQSTHLNIKHVIAGSMLVVVGGKLAGTKVEIIDLDNEITCDINDIPATVEIHAMATLNQQPLYCGGYDGDTSL